jgi:peptide chain release factor subunit 1
MGTEEYWEQEVDKINKDIQDLSEIYDTKDTFLSLYLNLEKGVPWKFIEAREKQCLSALKGVKELVDSFNKNMEKLNKYLRTPSSDFNQDFAKGMKGLALFISESNDYFKSYKLPLAFENKMVVDTSPYIRDLVQVIDDWETYGFILLDTNSARMYLVSMGTVIDEKKLSAHIMNKHKKGGWSQMRFQRLRTGAIDHFYKKVLDDLGTFLADEKPQRIILAGPGDAKHHFFDMLPQEISEHIIELVDFNIEMPEDKLIKESIELAQKAERKEETQIVERLRNEILKGGKVVYGIKETVEATRNGQVSLLVVNSDYKLRGWICEHCQAVEAGVKKSCPYCGKETSEVDVIEEIVEFAARTDAKIEFVEHNEILDELGGVGAFLRF